MRRRVTRRSVAGLRGGRSMMSASLGSSADDEGRETAVQAPEEGMGSAEQAAGLHRRSAAARLMPLAGCAFQAGHPLPCRRCLRVQGAVSSSSRPARLGSSRLTGQRDGGQHVGAQIDGEDEDGGQRQGEVHGHVQEEGDLQGGRAAGQQGPAPGSAQPAEPCEICGCHPARQAELFRSGTARRRTCSGNLEARV